MTALLAPILCVRIAAVIPSRLVFQLISKDLRVWKLGEASALLILAIAILFPAGARAQGAGNNSQAVASAPAIPATGVPGKLAFDAASVRPSSQKFIVKGWDFFGSSEATPPTGGLFSWNVPLPQLIYFAYDLRSQQARRGVWDGLPKWAQDEWYAVEARAEGNPSRDDVRQMVRALLEERFQFAGHLEERTGPVYALVAAKPGLGLKSHPDGAPCTLSSSQVDEKNYPHVYPSYKAFPVRCGVFRRPLNQFGESRLELLDVTMRQVADSLSSAQPLPVIDKTGLIGRFDAVLDFGSVGVSPDDDSSEEIGLPPLPAALEEQLGLKLVKQTGQANVFVIDRIAALSEN